MLDSGNDNKAHRSKFWGDAGGARAGGDQQRPDPPSVAHSNGLYIESGHGHHNIISLYYCLVLPMGNVRCLHIKHMYGI